MGDAELIIPMTPERKGRTRILLPCGIGDVYWSLVKFQSFCKYHKIKEKPAVAIITTTPDIQYAGSEFRSLAFLKMVPFVDIDDPPNREARPKPTPKWLNDIYMEMWHGSKTDHPGFMGYDHFLVYNGASITAGVPLEEVDDLECDWYFPLTVSDEQAQFQAECKKKYGPYAMYQWTICGGGYSVEHHVKEFSVAKIIESTKQFTKRSGLTPVFVGSYWDMSFGNNYLKDIIAAVPGSVNLVGKTSIDQLFGLIKGSEIVVGAHCGPTIMATAFHKKTIMMWAKSYPQQMFTANSPLVVAPPDTRNTTYRPLWTKDLTVDAFVGKMMELYEDKLIGTCLCGSHQFKNYEKASYHIEDTGASVATENKFGECAKCGVVQQLDLPFHSTGVEYERFYAAYPPTTAEYTAKNWDHDLQLARTRSDVYKLTPESPKRVLDVGCGSGAFVHECRSRSQVAYGCEISTYAYAKPNDYIYRQAFEKVNFPTDHFDLVTCHDVLEHTLDPKRMLAEMFRVTKQNGTCVVDFPHFFDEAGKHHWKDAEHIWYFNREQLEAMLKKTGFTIASVESPIPSKLVFNCTKPVQKRLTILVPPGFGDAYWSIVKLQSFLAANKLGLPDVTLVSETGRNSSHLRSLGFLEMFPFMRANNGIIINDTKLKATWHEAYAMPGRTVFTKVAGYDYFLSYNGHLRVGKQLENVDPNYKCDWHPPMFVSLEQERYRAESQRQYSPYYVCYFPFYTTYSKWARDFNEVQVAKTLNVVTESLNMRPVFAGAAWDRDDPVGHRLVGAVKDSVNLMGTTTVEQLFGLLRGAELVVGHPSGLTILAASLGIPTLIVWNHYYNKNFAWFCAPPDVRSKTYFIDWTFGLTAERLSKEIISLAKEGCVDAKIFPQLINDSVFMKTLPDRSTITAPRVVHRSAAVVAKPVVQSTEEVPTTSISREGIKLTPDAAVTTAVLCVLKSGGSYTVDYVQKLKNMVARHSTVPHEFICLTDENIKPEVCKTIPLAHNLEGWWSKLELFRTDLTEAGRIVYFDLDTVITNNIDDVLKLNTEFAALGDFMPTEDRGRADKFGSGMMVWYNNGYNYSFMLEEFSIEDTKRRGWNCGDQRYIVESLVGRGYPRDVLQNLIPGIYSFKRNDCARALPNDARIICFHGKPKPHEALGVKWVRNYWR